MLSIVFALTTSLVEWSGAVADGVPPASSTSACTDVYLTVPHEWGNSFPKPIFEVSVSVDGTPFISKGKLSMIDWGAFKACGRKVILRFRSILERHRASGPLIKDFARNFEIDVEDSRRVFFRLGNKEFRVISDDVGEAEVSYINSWVANFNNTAAKKTLTGPSGQEFTRGPMYITGWDWIDRREFYYGKGSICTLEKNERCP